jgi:hypothetical protein
MMLDGLQPRGDLSGSREWNMITTRNDYPRPSDYPQSDVNLRGAWGCVLAHASALCDLHHGSLAMAHQIAVITRNP